MMTMVYRWSAIALLLLSAAGAQAQNEGKKELVQKMLQLQRPGIETLARTMAEQPAAVEMPAAAGLSAERAVAAHRRLASRLVEAAPAVLAAARVSADGGPRRARIRLATTAVASVIEVLRRDRAVRTWPRLTAGSSTDRQGVRTAQ